jgi:hypothetical protein
MNLSRTLKKYQQKYYGPGSPLRFLRKATLELAHPGASRERSRLGASLAANLPAHQQQQVADLEKTGYADAGEELDPALLDELSRTTDARMASGYQGTKIRSFFTKMTSDEDLRSESIYVRFALQPALQKLVCAYFDNSVPYLAEISLILSTGTDAKEWSESQLWHLDYADSRTILVWVYLSDVNEIENGPFTYIPVEASSKVPNSFFPARVTDQMIDDVGLTSATVRVYGPKRKAFYVDTSRCYHLGSRLKPGQQRLVYLATFITHKPLYPLENGIQTNGELSEVEKCLLKL